MEDKFSSEKVVKSMVSGGLAGMCAKTAVAPLDRCKILLQAQNVHYKDMGVYATLKKIVQQEKAAALFKGNGAQLVRVFPSAGIQFATYETLKVYLPKVTGLDKNQQMVNFLAGAGAGVTSVSLTFPLDTIRVRVAFQVGSTKSVGIIQTGKTIVSSEGCIGGLYRGLLPTLVSAAPLKGLQFFFFEFSKSTLLQHCSFFCSVTEDGDRCLSVPAHMVCGGLSAAVAQTVTYPVDVARRRMQLGQFSGGMLSVMMATYKESGVMRGLYRGLSTNYIRGIPNNAITFGVYEVIKQMIWKDKATIRSANRRKRR